MRTKFDELKTAQKQIDDLDSVNRGLKEKIGNLTEGKKFISAAEVLRDYGRNRTANFYFGDELTKKYSDILSKEVDKDIEAREEQIQYNKMLAHNIKIRF